MFCAVLSTIAVHMIQTHVNSFHNLSVGFGLCFGVNVLSLA